MSEKFKLKYEVVAILRDTIIKGLEAFGIPISETPGDGGWVCMESDQPSFRNADNAVLFWHEKSERIGWQGHNRKYDAETELMEVVDYFIEQQIWRIKVLCKRTTEEITEESLPLTAEDVTSMLVGWFNRMGCAEFRKHNMANLFIQMKDVRTYNDKSDVSQKVAEFPIKLQVVKQFESDGEAALPKYAGTVKV